MGYLIVSGTTDLDPLIVALRECAPDGEATVTNLEGDAVQLGSSIAPPPPFTLPAVYLARVEDPAETLRVLQRRYPQLGRFVRADERRHLHDGAEGAPSA